jgi:ATP-binding protein involved in chromosome partitioning
MTFRTYHDVAGDDRSHLAEQVGAQRARVAARLHSVRRVIAVLSGKGGVGKSYIAARIAQAACGEARVGVLDADLRSPTVARLLGATGPLRLTEDALEPAVTPEGIRVMSTDLLLAEGAPLRWREPATERFVWRGAMETGALREFLGDVGWGELDLLLVDLPPGADGASDLVALVPELAGAVVVTIPSEEARRSVARTMRAAREAGIPLLGIVENMAGYRCGDCAAVGPLFSGTAGATLAAEFSLPLLARIPFVPEGAGAPSDTGMEAIVRVCLGQEENA